MDLLHNITALYKGIMIYGVWFRTVHVYAIAIWFDIKSKQFCLCDNNSVNEFGVEYFSQFVLSFVIV